MLDKPEKIIKFIRTKSDHPMKMKELAKALGIPNPMYSQFRQVIKALISSGELVKLKRGRIGLASEMNVRVGIISVARGGFGFLIVEDEERDIFLPSSNLGTALDGDKVMVRLTGVSDDRKTGTVIKIVERTQRNIVGIFQKGRNFSAVVPDNKKLHRDIYIPPDKILNAKDGEKVVAVITEWDDPYRNPEGEIIERLGFPNQPGVDMLTIVKSYNFVMAFPDEVLSGAEQASATLYDEEIARRYDFTGDDVYTIDPSDAKDYDDAVSVTKDAQGFSLSVHIADVSYFVKEGTPLDKEAFQRGNSVYLPGMVIPMLPVILSNDVCSLKPNKKRLAFTVVIKFDKKGKMLSWRLYDSVIKSKAKFSYEEIQEYFDNGEASDKIKRVSTNLTYARELAKLLNFQRFKQGSLDFDLPESMIILNKKGEVTELGNKVRLEAHRLVEEFMLVANKAVALEVFRKAQPFIYRVHDKPDIDKLESFSSLVKQLGYHFTVSPQMKPVTFAKFLNKIQDVPEADFINELMLRSMQKAVYQRENIGHFGLAFDHYSHFTSPIRRYPDLLVHRLLRKLKNGRYPHPYAKKVHAVIDAVSSHCSDTERVAERAEREAVKIKQMSFMAKHVGSEYSAVISGVTAYGFYVRLDNLGAEGMVRMSTIDDDYYHYDEKNYRIIGQRNKRVYRLGDKIIVGVLKVDKVAGEMDLFIVQPPKNTKIKTSKQKAKKIFVKNKKAKKSKQKR